MKVQGKQFESIWLDEEDSGTVNIIDQRYLPFEFIVEKLTNIEEITEAIKNMHLRGAPLIGAAAALGIYLAVLKYNVSLPFDQYIVKIADTLKASRPTAVNLEFSVEYVLNKIIKVKDQNQRIILAKKAAQDIIHTERENCKRIGIYGLSLIEKLSKEKAGKPVNILTHCNAGWLACIEYGTATAPVYMAFDKGIKVHVWVDETRPRNQGARLTTWELSQHGVPNTLIPDNTGGHLMQHGKVDLVVVGSDRTTLNGDVGNKIGTYLKALAAKDNNIPFYVALPSSSIDWNLENGLQEIPIEERDGDEVKYMEGKLNNAIFKFLITDSETKVANYGFDVTPARLITGLITERGICKATKNDILKLFPEKIN
ncbi:MAG: S-methyl-5-thioribose-1-phosphate isomerase [Bacteroidales bacterium]|nr:S-methyl-5-thioribose-1-phosphate isomerase [Bacteroidales bacterium]